MASQLNSYRNFINIGNKEGKTLVANAIDKFISPLIDDERISLVAKDYQKLKDNVNRLGSHYGYNHLFKHCATTKIVIPEIIADATATPPIAGVPESITYSGDINLLETYSDENVELTIKHASLTWGDCSFTVMATNTIDPLSQANRF
jgi:hypothetical protein